MRIAIGIAVSVLAVALCNGVCAQGAPATLDRTVLPIDLPPFEGRVAETYAEARGAFPPQITAPIGAPNVFLALTDDVGFAAASTFGGPLPTPNLDRLAARGLVYNRFHVTAICSATRAALLTGRNHHAVGNGIVSNMTTGFPGYNGLIPKSAATIAEVLRQNGYSTAMFGKNHTTPEADVSPAGPFDRWPTGVGFDYFYGFMSDQANQFKPGIYRGTDRLPTLQNTILDKALADDAIRWLHNQDAAGTDRPFFIYYAPGSTHMPHQAPADWITRFRGKFDQGWDVIRAESMKRQIAKGIVPRGTVNTPRPQGVPAWASLTPDQKRIAVRFMEAYAAMLAYQDDQIGRVLDEIDRMGKGDDTLVIFIEGDNGAQAAPAPIGMMNPFARFFNGYQETEADYLAVLDKIGGPDVLADYGVGWAWGMSAPFPYFKAFASHLGGTRNGMVVSWPKHISERGIRSQFTHVNDVMPTILEAAGLPTPTLVNGIKQQPLNGVSFAYSFAESKAPDRHTTQYFETFGNRGIYHDGWLASTTPALRSFDAAANMANPPALLDYKWELYNLKNDFSQSRDLAARYPDKLTEMRKLFDAEARANNVYPLDDRTSVDRFFAQRLRFPTRKHFTYWGEDISVPPFRAPPLFTKSFTITANLDIPQAGAEGTILAFGGRFGGWSFFLKDGKPGALMAASQLERDRSLVTSERPIGPGSTTVTFAFARQEGAQAGGTLTISVAGKEVARGPIKKTISLLPDPTGGFDIGFDGDAQVTDFFTGDARFVGAINRVDVDVE